MPVATALNVDPAAIRSLIQTDLLPIVNRIDQDGEYPEAFLRTLGSLGGFGGVVLPDYGGTGRGLADTIATMAQVGEVCLSTAFAFWCHTSCARFIQVSNNTQAKTELLPDLACGGLLGGTGLSNTFKSSCEIERFLLSARRVEGGYEIHGNLPWVSNLGADHVFVAGCPVEGDGRLVFFVVHCDQDGFKLKQSAHFTALEGTRTFSCHFRAVRIDDARVLAHPDDAKAYVLRIQPGMILAQMGLGLVRDCVRLIESTSRTQQHINCFETDQAEELAAALAGAEAETTRLAALLDGGAPTDALPAILLNVMRLRLAVGELSLRAANAAMLHQGSRGYLRDATAQRRLREAYFVAIVTPSLKHLRREIARREAAQV